MAAKKKKTAQVTDAETKIENKETKLSQKLNYSGELSISIKSKSGKITKLGTSHNSGGPKLFSFFANCLAGLYSNAETDRPKYIKLYHNNDTSSITFNGALSDRIFFNNVGVEDRTEGKVAVIHFTVPISFINTSSTVNQFALFGTASGTDSTDYLANYFGTEIDLSGFPPNSVLLLDWALRVGN